MRLPWQAWVGPTRVVRPRSLRPRRPCGGRRPDIEALEGRALLALSVAPFIPSPPNPPTTIVDALLVPDTGLSPVSAQYTGAAGQGGTYSGFAFTSGSTELAIADGVILTTGRAADALLPRNPDPWSAADNLAGIASTDLGTPGDNDLRALLGGASTFDANVLTLNFTRNAEIRSVLFDVVFATDEFPLFVDYDSGRYNDSFAAFLDGQPMRTAPGAPPIGSNGPTLTLNNTDEVSEFTEGKTQVTFVGIHYQGLTARLTLQATLDPARTSHTIKFVIADAGDRLVDSAVFLASLRGSNQIVGDSTLRTPTISWSAPQEIVYGTPLSAAQLNAEASTGGLFTYNPGMGNVLNAGLHTLTAAFTPDDPTRYATAEATTTIRVLQARPEFYAIAAPTITQGGGWATVTGRIVGNGLAPDGQVAVTLEGPAPVTILAAIDPATGAFWATFETADLPADTYSLHFAYAGSANFEPAETTAALEISSKVSPAFEDLASPTILIGSLSATLAGRIAAGSLTPTGAVSIRIGDRSFTAVIGNDGRFQLQVPAADLSAGVHPVLYSFAGSSRFEAAEAQGTLTVAYDVETIHDPDRAVKSGATIPIRLRLRDALGRNLAAASIAVAAVEIVDEAGNRIRVQSPGNSNPGGLFRYDAGSGQYVFNLKTTGLAAGRYRLRVLVGDDPTLHEILFLVR